MRGSRNIAILAAAIVGASAVSTRAAVWNNASGGEWGTSSGSHANWTPADSPGVDPGDVAIINLVTGTTEVPGSPYTIYKNVNFTSTGSLSIFTLDSPQATLQLPASSATSLRPIYMAADGVATVNRGTIEIYRGSGSNPVFGTRSGTGTLSIGAGGLIDVRTMNGINAIIANASMTIIQQNGTIQVGVNGAGPYKQHALVSNGFANGGTIELSNNKTGAPTDGATPDSNTIFEVTSGTLSNTGTIKVSKGASDGSASIVDGFGTRSINERNLVLKLENQTTGLLDVTNAGLQAARLGRATAESHTNSGTIAIASNTTLALTANNTLANQDGGVIRGNGTLDVNATGAALSNAGILAAGGSAAAGTLTIDGGFTSSDTASLAIELASAVSYDVLNVVDGTAGLDGALDVSFLSGFTPDQSDAFTILTGLNSGGFDNVIGGVLDLGNGFQFDVDYNSSSVVLSNYSPTAVPEPAAVALLGLGSLALFRRRRA